MQQRTKIAVAVAVALQTMGGLAMAQQAADAPQRVEVTGSRIRQVDLETAQPIQVMTQEQIKRSGLVTVGEIVNSLSSTGNPSFSRGNALTSNREQGGQFPSLRNLGGQRLLVLVNGKRWTQTVAGFTDMSTIPSSMIERVEVLKDGGSSIYGSDAIAGVVNIILKKSMEGGEASAYYGQNELGDGKNSDYSLTYGAGNDKASLMLGISHTSTGTVWAKDREITRFGSGRVDRLSTGLGGGPWGRITGINASGGSSTTTPIGNKYLNHTGSYDGAGTGANSRDPNSYHAYTGADADTFNSSQQMHFLSPSRMTSIFVKGSIELPKSMRLTTTAMYADRLSSRQIAGYPLTSTTQSKFPVYIDKDNYFNPYGNQVAGAGKGQDLYFARRTIEVPRVTDNTNRTLHIDATLEGELNFGSKVWNWDVGYNHSAISGDTISTGNLNLVNLKKALGPSFKNASGVVQCGTPGSPIPAAECVPWDILGGPSASTPAALTYSMAQTVLTYGSNIDSATANITGEVFDLPAGGVGVATGLEYRTAKGYDRPDMMQRSGISTDLGGQPTAGEYNVKEAYLEVNVPLLKGKPFAELLSVNLATRYSDYSNFGSTSNSKASLMWKPVKDLLVRGTYAEGFRAPTLSDSFGGGSQSYDTFLDPCDTKLGQAATQPEVAARCTGVPAGYRQVNQAGSPVTAATQSPFPSNSGAGNADIRPETAQTKTAGFVYSPSWINGLSVAVDWFDILVENRISGVSATQTLTFCYINNDPTYCNKLRRDPVTGMIVELNRGNSNLGAMHTRGADVAVNYRFPRSTFGQFGMRWETTWVNSFETKSTNVANYVEFVGEAGIPRFRSNLNLDWTLGNWSTNLGTRFYSRINDRCVSVSNPVIDCNMPTQRYSGGLGVNQLPSNYYLDLSVSYKFPWNARLMVGANNILDKKPFLVYTAGTSSSSAVDAERPIDRFIWMRYTQSF